MEKNTTSLEDLISKVKRHPLISQAGMILCHNGIVRASDRSGEKTVSALQVAVNSAEIDQVKNWAESCKGIVAVEIQAFEGKLQVGEDLLYVVIAGDIRENVFAVMRETIDRIKAGGVQKTEYYAE